MVLTLPDWLSGLVFTGLLLFTRIGAAFLALPGLGSVLIPTQVRLLLALAFSAALAPLLAARLPGLPASVPVLVLLLAMEALVGLFLGTVAKVLLVALETAGSIISSMMGLSSAILFDPAQGTQATLPGTFLGQAGLALIFVTDLHALLLQALVDSYTLFPPATAPETGSMAAMLAQVLAGSFEIGLRMAAPFVIAAILLNAGLGLLNRLMPTLQVFFVAAPLSILIGLGLLILSTFAMLRLWAMAFGRGIQPFLLP